MIWKELLRLRKGLNPSPGNRKENNTQNMLKQPSLNQRNFGSTGEKFESIRWNIFGRFTLTKSEAEGVSFRMKEK